MSALSVTQPAPACTEHELVAALRGGSDRAFEELYARYGPQIRAYIVGMVRDHARSEDIAQEVFISALRRLRETERPVAFQSWIYEIAKNACIDEFRRTRRVREIPLEADDDSGAIAVVEPVGNRYMPEAAVERKQSLADLRDAFHSLSEQQHKILVMRELEGYSYTEIGERLGMSRFMVESTLFRARRRITAEYNELASGRRCEQIQTAIETYEPRVLRKLGVRERRQIARHLAHCQPCRRHARMAGLDESFFKAPTLVGKIAALLPFPWLRWRRSSGEEDSAAASSTHSYMALQSLPTVARLVDPSGSAAGFGRTAAAAAAVVVAGIGGGVVTAVRQGGHHPVRSIVAAPAAFSAPAIARPVGAARAASATASVASALSGPRISRSASFHRSRSRAGQPAAHHGSRRAPGGSKGGQATGPLGTILHTKLPRGVGPPRLPSVHVPQGNTNNGLLGSLPKLPQPPALPKVSVPPVKPPAIPQVKVPSPKQAVGKLIHS